MDVKTRAAEGLLFFAATRGGRAHLALYMSKGRIRLSVGKEKEIFNREKYNDGKWHTVSGLASSLSSLSSCLHVLTKHAGFSVLTYRSCSVWRRSYSDWLWMVSEHKMVR